MSDIDYLRIGDIMHDINDNSHIQIEDIPEYKLYISQIEELFEKKLGNIDELDDDKKVLSKTMIQNYIKDGLVMPPDGKSYNKNHIILLIFIYNLKSILTIKDIKKLLFPLIDIAQSDSEKIDIIYENYIKVRERLTDTYIENFTDAVADVYEDFELEQFAQEWPKESNIIFIVFLLVLQADMCKKTAEYLIDTCLSND